MIRNSSSDENLFAVLSEKEKVRLKNLYNDIKLEILSEVRKRIVSNCFDLNNLECSIDIKKKLDYFEEAYLNEIGKYDGIEILVSKDDSFKLLRVRYKAN